MKAPAPGQNLAITWIFFSGGLLFLTLRLHHRLRIQHRQLTLSDYFICCAVVMECCNRGAGTYILSRSLRLSQEAHTQQLKNTEYFEWKIQELQFHYFQAILWAAILTTIKCSFLATYFQLHRANPDCNRAQYLMLIFIAFSIIGCYLFPQCLFYLTYCNPMSENWNPNGNCNAIQYRGGTATFNVANIFTDILIIGYGLALVKQLGCARKEFYASIFIAALGMVSMGACITRWVVTWQSRFNDQMLWCSIEANSGIIAACLPAFRSWLRGSRERRLCKKNLSETMSPARSVDGPGVAGLEPVTEEVGVGFRCEEVTGVAGAAAGTANGSKSTLAMSPADVADEEYLWPARTDTARR